MKAGMVVRQPSSLLFYVRYYLTRFSMKNYDVILVSYPKSGRTWLEQILLHIVRARYDLNDGQLMTYQDVITSYPTYPRILFTHAGSSWESELIDENDILRKNPERFGIKKCAFLYRDPRDIQVSVYHHVKYRTGIKALNRESMLSDPIVGIRKVVRFMNSWANYCETIGVDAYSISYETLRKEPKTKLVELLRFLSFDATEKEIDCAIEQTNFRKMQKREQAGASRNPWLTATDRSNRNSFKVRSGKIGSYVDFFSKDERQRIQKILSTELSPRFPYGVDDDGVGEPG